MDEQNKEENKKEEQKAKTDKELAEEYLAGWQRAKADLANYKKDESKRLEEVAKFSNEVLVRELINMLDSFDLGMASLADDSKAQKGMFLIRAQLEDILKKFGLERIIVSPGDPFNPALQEAIGEVADSGKPGGAVVEEIERGYTLFGRVVRPARVKVAK